MCFNFTSCVMFCTAVAVTNHLLSDADYCLTYDSHTGRMIPAARRVSSETSTTKCAKLKSKCELSASHRMTSPSRRTKKIYHHAVWTTSPLSKLIFLEHDMCLILLDGWWVACRQICDTMSVVPCSRTVNVRFVILKSINPSKKYWLRYVGTHPQGNMMATGSRVVVQ